MEKEVCRLQSIRDSKLIIELAGPPNGGKDTQIAILVRCLRAEGKRVAVVEDGFTICPLIGQPSSLKFHWAMAHTTRKLVEYASDKAIDIIILNRGPFDLIALARFWSARGAISKDEAHKTIEYLLSNWADWVDTVFLLDISPKESMHREQAQGEEIAEYLFRKYNEHKLIPPRKIVCEKALGGLNKAYDQAVVAYQQSFELVRVPPRTIGKVADSLMQGIRGGFEARL